MTGVSNNMELFGLDLAAIPGHYRAGWAEALRWPAFSWLRPARVVRVLHADGTVRIQTDDGRASGAPPSVAAVVLPDQWVLCRTLRLPRLDERELHAAAALEASSLSPFPEEDLAWGYALVPGGGSACELRLAMASKRQIDAYIEALRARPGIDLDGSLEIWSEGSPPVVLQKPERGTRAGEEGARRRRWVWSLFLLAALQLGALLVTPAAQARLQAIQAQLAYDALAARTSAQVDLRAELMEANARLDVVGRALERQGNPLQMLDALTRLLPDDVVLNRLDVSEGAIRIAGMADNASGLMSELGASGRFRDVTAPTPSTRPPGAAKDNFTFDMRFVAEGEASR